MPFTIRVRFPHAQSALGTTDSMHRTQTLRGHQRRLMFTRFLLCALSRPEVILVRRVQDTFQIQVCNFKVPYVMATFRVTGKFQTLGCSKSLSSCATQASLQPQRYLPQPYKTNLPPDGAYIQSPSTCTHAVYKDG